jgi:hypothetical protein
MLAEFYVILFIPELWKVREFKFLSNICGVRGGNDSKGCEGGVLAGL